MKHILAMPAALLATLLAIPVNAGIVIPDEPLTTGTRVAPNILFILDDSGSMTDDYMPDSVPSTSTPNVSMLAYTRNTLSYNPAITYQAWVQADGNRMTGGMNYSGNVYSSDNGTSGSLELYNTNPIFYVPKDTTRTDESYLGDGKNYWRYEIQTGGSSIVRSEYGAPTISNNALAVSPDTGTVNGTGSNDHWTAPVLADGQIKISIKSTLNSVLYWMYDPNGTQICSGQVNNGNTQTCTSQPSIAGKYKIVTKRWNNTNSNANYGLTANYSDTNRCDGGFGTGNTWINCTSALPNATRNLSQELTNYATWYSYHRTRIKSAKAGAGEAFAPLNNRVRVGFRTIWGRGANNSYPIPVASSDGRFIDDPANSVTNRTDWYKALYAASGSSSTPLQKALADAGTYFSSSDQSGPYGPESGSAQFTCRQNFTILTTDGYWNGSNQGSGNVDNASGTTIYGSNNRSYQYSPTNPYKDDYSNTLADVAMYYWRTDLRTDTDKMGKNQATRDGNNVPTTADDPAFWQHMVTFGISIGLVTSRGWSSVEEAKTAIAGGASWPDPKTDKTGTTDAIPARLDDLLHAAVNGRGTFVAATNPQKFTEGLKNALAAIAQRTSSFSNVATNSTSLNTGAQVFAASYTSGLWTGKVQAFAVSHTGGVSATPTWTATIPAPASRKVFTWNGTAGATFPTTAQTTSLDRSGVGPANFEVSGAENANYIKGDTSKEEGKGGILRARSTVLGDIVNSSPAFVAKTNTIYVGANDGMLHAFDAGAGAELFAYVPSIIDTAGLGSISRGDYEHKFFVDGPVVVSPYNSYVANKNILVGTLGRGGKGLYALNVTNPSSFSTNDVMWEVKDTANGNMGRVLGAPIMGMVRNGTSTPAVVLGNGPNSTSDKAVLIVLNMETGTVIKEIPTDNSTNNGLFAPVGVFAADGKTLIYVYAGDLQGNIWKFDLTNTSSSAWSATKIFHAEKTAGKPQSITSAPVIAVDPMTGKRWVFFGTGRYLTADDVNDVDVSTQSMYGFVDDGGGYTRSSLTPRSVTVSGDYRYFDATSALTKPAGWYVDLPGKGERIVQNAQINGTFLVTASMMPSGDSCADAAGTGFINSIDAFTGTSGGTSMFDLNRDGKTDDTGAGGKPIGSVNTGVGMPTLPVILPGQIVVGGSGNGTNAGLGGTGTFSMSWQRVSWRELRND